MITEIKTQEGTNLSYLTLVDHVVKWIKINHLIFNKIEKENCDLFISKHELGRNWSELECKTYANAFELIGKAISNIEFEDDIFSFEVVKHKK